MRMSSRTQVASGAQSMRLAAFVVLALATSACSKKAPSGQVVATVNGKDITQSEYNLELAALGVPADAPKEAKAAVLQQMVDRTLLVQDAEKQKLDKNPDFLLADRRAHDALLAQKALQVATAGLRQTPTEKEVNAFLDSHPAVGDQRRVLIVDQIKFPAPRSPAEMKALGPLKTMDQIAAYLQRSGLPAERSSTKVDTAVVPDAALAKLTATTSGGEPIVVVQGQVAMASAVSGTEPVPATAASPDKVARARVLEDRLTKAVQERGAGLRRAAKISYAPGVAPPPPAKPAS